MLIRRLHHESGRLIDEKRKIGGRFDLRDFINHVGPYSGPGRQTVWRLALTPLVIGLVVGLHTDNYWVVFADNPESIDAEDYPESSSSDDGGHGFVGFRLGAYHNDDDGDGNPFLDEKLTVIEPVVIFDYNLTDKTAIWGKFSYDYVSSASIERLSKFPLQSGASGDYYYGLDIGLRRDVSDTLRTGGFVSASTEYDYNSIGIGGNIAKDSPDKNATVKVSVNGFWDRIEIIRFNGQDNEGDDDRISVSSNLNWYQIIDAKTHSEVGTAFSYQTGFLETAFNAVVIEDANFIPNPNLDNTARGVEITEEVPGKRLRGAIFGRLRRYIDPHSAIELYGRVYTDSWGIDSLTLEPGFHHWVVEDMLRLRIRYRFYLQSDADGFQDHFFRDDRFLSFRSQDSDLGDFSSHAVGLKLDWHVTDNLKCDFSGNYTSRDDGIDQVTGSFGFTRQF